MFVSDLSKWFIVLYFFVLLLFFCNSIVLPDTSRKSRQKTRVVKRTANPMFNHTMVYDGFRPEDLREACVELTVWDHDRLNNHYIGGLRLGLGTGKTQLSCWWFIYLCHTVYTVCICHCNKIPFVPFCAGKSYGVEVVWMDSTSGEAQLWQRMLESDGEWVEGVLPLRMFVMAKSMSKWG